MQCRELAKENELTGLVGNGAIFLCAVAQNLQNAHSQVVKC